MRNSSIDQLPLSSLIDGSTGGPAEILCQDQGNVIRSDKNFVVKIDSDSYSRRKLKPTAVGTVSDVAEDEPQKATCVDWKLALLLSGVRKIRGIKRCSCRALVDTVTEVVGVEILDRFNVCRIRFVDRVCVVATSYLSTMGVFRFA